MWQYQEIGKSKWITTSEEAVRRALSSDGRPFPSYLMDVVMKELGAVVRVTTISKYKFRYVKEA